MATGLQNAGRVCYATLLTTDTYLHGALTLAASLRETGTQNEIVCLVADSQLSRPALERLETMFDRIISIPMLDTNDVANLSLLGRPDLGTTVTKIGVWSLTEYRRIVFLDADTLVFQSLDSLLELDLKKTFENSNMTIGDDIRPNGGMANRGLLAAAPDLGWPDCFNSGVFVATPSKSTHAGLLQLLSTRGSFDGEIIITLFSSIFISSSPPLSSHIPHSTDKAWKKEGCDYAAIEGRSDDDNWVTFTPAPDFVLDSSPNPN
ncbi:glycogenin glucosyltransferase [Coemansia sp. RSA 1813]|nr:glycogenin glucosyltransferase [Coemansia sp. RSA 1813]